MAALTLTPVHGTWPEKDQSHWHRPGSVWWSYMISRGAHPMAPASFEWNGRLNGTDWKWILLELIPFVKQDPRQKFEGWIEGAIDAIRYFTPYPVDERIVIAHSHGLQPILIAAALGLNIHGLVSVGSPVRHDVMAWVKQEYHTDPREHIRWWEHVYDLNSDLIGSARPTPNVPTPQRLGGGLGDGVISIDRYQPWADLNTTVAGIDHSELVFNADKMHFWEDAGILPRLREI